MPLPFDPAHIDHVHIQVTTDQQIYTFRVDAMDPDTHGWIATLLEQNPPIQAGFIHYTVEDRPDRRGNRPQGHQ
jgi:hypothetical protein